MFNRCLATLIFLFVATPSLRAEGDKAAEDRGMGMWNADVMVKQAADQIISRYKLNEEQSKFTRELMARRVNELLDKHEKTVRELFREAMVMRLAGKPPTNEAIQSWAQRALPVYEEAKKQIIDGNEEWGKILTPDQKKTHEIDLKMMKIDFVQYEQKLSRWSQGGFEPKKDWIVPQSAANRPATPPPSGKPVQPNPPTNRFAKRNEAQMPVTPPANRPGGGPPMRIGETAGRNPTSGPAGSAIQAPTDPEQHWDAWVSDFVRQCRLDEGQTGQAKAILKDCKDRANRHRDAHRDDYVRLTKRVQETNPEAVAQASKELGDLNAPINDLFEELKGRVEGIATSAQLQNYQRR